MLGGISGGNAVFNPEKLDWFNQQHIMRLAPDEVARRVQPSLAAAGLWDDSLVGDRHAWFFAVLELLKPRAKKLDDIVEVGRFFFVDLPEYDAAAVEKHLRAEGDRRPSSGTRRRVRGAAAVRCGVDRGRTACGGRRHWCEGSDLDSCGACRGHG